MVNATKLNLTLTEDWETISGGVGSSGSNRVAGWRLEDIDDNLAADFDGSLSGLGVDLSVASYNMRSVGNVISNQSIE